MRAALSSLTFLGIFLLGVLLGAKYSLPSSLDFAEISQWALYVLMLLVGITIGGNTQILQAIKHLSPSTLLLPAVTIIGTILGVSIAYLLTPSLSFSESQAVGAGYGYYSLSSIIITKQHSATIGAIALISNIIRELTAIILAPLFARYTGPLSPICAAGATSMDTGLPFIIAATSPEYSIIAIYHGIALSVLTPIAVGIALSL